LIGGTPQDKENSNFQVFQRTASLARATAIDDLRGRGTEAARPL
jgi:hypothetical protein